MDDAGLMQIEGYRRCHCGELVLEHVAWMTGGVCFGCFMGGEYGRVREIEVAVRMRRVTIPTGYVARPNRSKRGSAKTRQLVEKAKIRALRRLKHLYPDMYDVVYAEERVKVHLEPIPQRVPNGWYNEVVTTYLAALPYHAAEPGAPDAAIQSAVEDER